MNKIMKEAGTMLVLVIIIVWLVYGTLGFHVFYAITLTLLLSTLSGGCFVLSAKIKKS